jgi:hypothetical protein
MSLSILLALGSVAAIAGVGYRDHRAAQRARQGLLDHCAGALDRAHLSYASGGFPRLEGSHRGRGVRVDLLLDTLTIRRLPQLWLSATLLHHNPGLPGLAVLVRPAGTEFYSLTARLPQRLEPPVGFPAEVLIRGEAGADVLLADLAASLRDILADPRVKEIAVTERGLRIVRQAAEGKRGEHLILRQSVFEDAAVPRADLTEVLDQLQAMRAITGAHQQQARAA